MIKALSYVGFSSPEVEAWKSFGPDILGLELFASDDDSVRLRLDEAAWRIAVHPGESNDISYIGWEVGGEEQLANAISTLHDNDIEVQNGEAELAAERGVMGIAWFNDPFGFRHELTYGQLSSKTTFKPTQNVSGFVTGDQGLGHIVIMTPDMQAATDFFVGLLGFRHSDDIEAGMKVRFMHCNPRHHTLAMTEIPGHRGLHHLMLQVNTIDDVGHAYDRAIAAGQPIAMTLGRHPNDLMTSFYVRTPSGFEIEYGTGGRELDMDKPEEPGLYDALSIWGHQPPSEPLILGILKPVE